MKISIRRDRFLKLSEKRLNKALAAIDSIENLSNKSNYDYEVDEINDMAGRLMARVKFVNFVPRPKPRKRPRRHKKSLSKSEKRSYKPYNRQGRRPWK